MTRIAPTQRVTVVSFFSSFLNVVERYRVPGARTLKLDSSQLQLLLENYGFFRASVSTLSLLPGGPKVVDQATRALDQLDIPKMLRNGFLVEGVLTRWYYQYIYPITKEIPIVGSRKLIDPGRK